MSVLKGFAVVSSAAIAMVATILLADYLPTAGPNDWWGYPALGYLAVVAAWVACFSWAMNARLLAAPAHLLSVFAPWRYFYPLPLLAVILALAAGATFKSSRKKRLPPPTPPSASSEVPAA
jgi:hypothetical protein